MKRARHGWLGVLALALVACPGGGGGPDPVAVHVLSRIGYGPDAWSLARIQKLGIQGYIEEQLDPASIPDPGLDARLAAYPSLSMGLYPLLANYGPQPGAMGDAFAPLLELMKAKLLRSIYGHRQLEQVLTDFWFDHFNVYGADGFTNYALGPYERLAIRPHVLGRFEDMLVAVARNPAMLYYLDNFLSTRAGFVVDGEERGINENWARELMELHTLSVEGPYTQQDVIEVARAFTGWTFMPPELAFLAGPDGFFFWPDAHDDAAKTVVDLEIPPGGGVQDGLDVLHYLAAHPSTASFLCLQLVQRFVDEDAPQGLVDQCAATYLAQGGNLREALRTILLSDDFLSLDHAGAKVKRPLVYVASLVRATGAELTPDMLEAMVFYLGLLGEPVYLSHPPTGFPDASSAWASGGTLAARFNLATFVAFSDQQLGIDWGVSSRKRPDQIVDALAAKLLPGGIDATTRDAAVGYVASLPRELRLKEGAALLLSSPAFMRH